MFDRYTEKARRTIFFAHCEASELGAAMIGSEHLLLGILREEKTLFLKLKLPIEIMKKWSRNAATLSPTGEKIPTSVDIRLNDEARQILRSRSNK